MAIAASLRLNAATEPDLTRQPCDLLIFDLTSCKSQVQVPINLTRYQTSAERPCSLTLTPCVDIRTAESPAASDEHFALLHSIPEISYANCIKVRACKFVLKMWGISNPAYQISRSQQWKRQSRELAEVACLLSGWDAGSPPRSRGTRRWRRRWTGGYRHIDTAYIYLNEEAVGAGIRNWLEKTGKSRGEIFVVTKLPMIGMNEGGVEKFLKKSLEKLQLGYVDLYLVHGPVGVIGKHDNDIFPVVDGKLNVDFGTDLIAVWKEMEKMKTLGLAKSIGVSNFSIKQLRKICAVAKIPPSVQQVELHAHFQQHDMQEFCKSHNIAITAYAPLGSPGRRGVPTLSGGCIPTLLEDPVVQLVAERHGVTTAQVLLRFLVQQGLIAIPKSVTPSRIAANNDVWNFALTDTELAALRSLDKGPSGRSFVFANRPG
ncbi:1,5-anhydro-D-fructose reductase-like [Penaeus monodon]|uniref:1,5-anhydro-D-fructose reductase-like n=1 Tax=Penaeus monodon TaxID=6687 RepID=UPI0018A7104A|nr:1,5-anhydro-D-fructose reductase-like [Penaeus monodon]